MLIEGMLIEGFDCKVKANVGRERERNVIPANGVYI